MGVHANSAQRKIFINQRKPSYAMWHTTTTSSTVSVKYPLCPGTWRDCIWKRVRVVNIQRCTRLRQIRGALWLHQEPPWYLEYWINDGKKFPFTYMLERASNQDVIQLHTSTKPCIVIFREDLQGRGKDICLETFWRRIKKKSLHN